MLVQDGDEPQVKVSHAMASKWKVGGGGVDRERWQWEEESWGH